MTEHPSGTRLARAIRCLSLACAAALAGCAALQIDVDVYKGPLAHEQEVQLRQFAALAIAAKPLLASVRNDLEDAYREKRLPSEKKLSWEQQPLQPYRDDYLPEPEARFNFKSNLARFINGSLLYYADLAPPEVNAVQSAAARLRGAMAVFKLRPSDAELVQQIDRAAAEATKPEVRSLAAAYRRFLCGDLDAAQCLREAKREEPASVGSRAPRFCSDCPRTAPGTIECPESVRSNVVFDFLQRPDRVGKHLRLIFGEQGSQALLDRVVEIAAAFHEARAAYRAILESGLALVDQNSHKRGQLPAAPLNLVAPVVARSLQPRMLSCALSATRLETAWKALPEPARVTLTEVGVSPNGRSVKWNTSHFKRVNFVMATNIVAHPTEMASFLRLAHQTIPHIDQSELEICTDHIEYGSPPARWYGLAAGPSSTNPFEDVLQELLDSAAALTDGAPASFHKARLPEGIETLTTRFLLALDRHQHRLDDPEVQLAQRKLEEALIFFAERMLVVVNNISSGAIRRELGVDVASSASVRTGDYLGPVSSREVDLSASLGSRMGILQTLGNNLILHANDLTRRAKQAREQEERRTGEYHAARLAAAPGAAAAYDAMLQHVRAQLEGTAGSAHAAGSAASAALARVSESKARLEAAASRAQAASDRVTSVEAEYLPLRALVRTVVPLAERKAALRDAAGPEQEMANDQASLAQHLQANVAEPDKATATTFLDALQGWLQQQTASPGTTPRLQRLRDAQRFLDSREEALRAASTVTSHLDDARQAVHGLLLQWLADTDAEVAELKQVALQATAERNAMQKAADQGDKRVKRQTAKTQEAEDKRSRAERVMSALKEAREEVVRSAERAGVADSHSLLTVVRQHLSETQRASASEKSSAAAVAAEFLRNYQPPPPPLLPDATGWEPKSSVAVFDQVIAQLRHSRIQAEATGETTRAQALVRAINAAYEARSGVAFLRPSSDYLKNAYSSNDLVDASTGTHGGGNLLNDWFQQLLERDQGVDRNTAEARLRTEKLFWQNINRVSLSGGGQTNYVLAKDDVGNWYVKAYSADPKKVIQAAQSLALFNAGRRIDTNLLQRAELQRELSQEKDPTRRSQLRSELKETGSDFTVPLMRVRDRYAEQYAVSMVGLEQALRQAAEAVVVDIRRKALEDSATSDTNADQLEATLRGARGELDAALSAFANATQRTADDKERLGKLEETALSTLDAFRRYRQQVGAKVTETTSVNEDAAKRQLLAKVARGVIADKLLPIVGSHKSAVEAYATALVNLGEVGAAQSP